MAHEQHVHHHHHFHHHFDGEVVSALQAIPAVIADVGARIMSRISEYAARQSEFNQQIGTAIDGITGDVQRLNDKITELQNSQGEISAEDQQLLNDLQAQGQALSDRLRSLDESMPAPTDNGTGTATL